MDKPKHKPVKKSDKNSKEKSPLFVSDVKNLKENLKIREILRNVKMNSSMRIKSPQCSKATKNKDVNDNEDCFEDASQELQDHSTVESNPSATNPNVITSIINIDTEGIDNRLQNNENIKVTINVIDTSDENNDSTTSNTISENDKDPTELTPNEGITENNCNITEVTSSPKPSNNIATLKPRDRKLSLDQTILSRRTGLSQSELDLNLIGKSPLERKSSFFRKKMDNFLKNTTEIFKRQSQSVKSQPSQRRGSKSISLQSLTDKSYCSNGNNNESHLNNPQEIRNSTTSLSTMARSSSMASSICPEGAEQDSPAGSQTVLFTSQPLGDYSSNSVNNLNEPYAQDSLLKSRAISMSSGLDAPQGRLRRKASKSNRVTWLASEGLTNYFKRVMQDEKTREVQPCHSYQDFSSIPEHASYGPITDSKGRRLSYQRAVSGEDPMLPARYYDSSQRRKNFIPEHQVPNFELEAKLEEFTSYGVPPLQGFVMTPIPEQALEYLRWAENPDEMKQFYNARCNFSAAEESLQAVVRELICTEADYIKHLKSLVEVFMAAAHGLQECGFILDVDTKRLFSNITEVYNASLNFWNATFFPMLTESIELGGSLRPEMMYDGFYSINEYFEPYEKYLLEQSKAVDYLRTLGNNIEFMTYLSWCHKQKECNRLQLADMLVKPMQRITKYALILNRIYHNMENDSARDIIFNMEHITKNYVLNINRYIRQREEKEKLHTVSNQIDSFELDFKDEEMDRSFRLYAQLDLQAPMLHCLHAVTRCVVFEGELRFRDNTHKEIDVRVFLFTDMMLICKRMPKGSPYLYKMIRPKYMIDKLHFYPKQNRAKEVIALVFVALDDFHSAYHSFTLSESSKEEKSQIMLKASILQIWDHKIKEAKISYELIVFFGQYQEMDNPSLNLEEDPENLKKLTPEELAIEREGREWAATMLHGRIRGDGIILPVDSFQITEAILSGNVDAARRWRNPVLRRYSSTTAGSSRTSRLSSFQKSNSAASRDEQQPGTSKAGYLCPSDSSEIPFERLETDDTYTEAIESDDEYSELLPPPPLLPSQLSRPPVLQPAALQQSIIRPEVIHELAIHPAMIQESIIHSPVVPEPVSPVSMLVEQIPSLSLGPITQPPTIIEPITPSIEEPSMHHATHSNPVEQSSAIQVHPNPEPPMEMKPNIQQPLAQQSMAVGIPIPIPVPFAFLPGFHGDAAMQNVRGVEKRKGKKGRGVHVPRARSVQSNRSDHNLQYVQRSNSVQCASMNQHVPQTERAQSAGSTYSLKSTQTEHVGHRRTTRGRRSKRAASASPDTLRVQPDNGLAAMLSLPNLNVEPPTPRHAPSPQSPSKQIYQSHNEQVQRNRMATPQYLSPSHRGTSYPPTRSSRSQLTRGLAFSYSLRHPPLTKMSHVSSQTSLLDTSSSSGRMTRSESTSPEPEVSPERRAKSAAGIRSNGTIATSGSTTHNSAHDGTGVSEGPQTDVPQDPEDPGDLGDTEDFDNTEDPKDLEDSQNKVTTQDAEVSGDPEASENANASQGTEAAQYAEDSQDVKALQVIEIESVFVGNINNQQPKDDDEVSTEGTPKDNNEHENDPRGDHDDDVVPAHPMFGEGGLDEIEFIDEDDEDDEYNENEDAEEE